MGRRRPIIRCVAVAVALAAAAAAAALEVPFLGGRVNDLAGLLSDDFETRLGSELETLERATGAQVVVLTIASLDGDPIEDFSMRVAETWKLGGERADNGVLVVIARDERLVRIEVGYGLEGALTDVESGRIIRGLMTPRFRAGDFDGGVGAAIDAIAAKLRGETVELPEERPTSALEGRPSGLVALIVFALFGLPFVNAALGSRGPAGWILSLMLAPFFFIVPAAAFGVASGAIAVLAWVVLFPILRAVWPKTSGIPGRRSMGGRGGIPPIWVGGSGWRGGGGSFGGGFSGGGGSFGGGGATGGW